jgi:hypothetical protein
MLVSDWSLRLEPEGSLLLATTALACITVGVGLVSWSPKALRVATGVDSSPICQMLV